MKYKAWFAHSLQSRIDDRMISFLEQHGAAGYGVFWIIIETLYQEADHRLPRHGKQWQRMARHGKISQPEFDAILMSLHDTELLEFDSDWVWSEKVNKEALKYQEDSEKTSEKRSIAGKKGAEVRWQTMANDGKNGTDRQTYIHTVKENIYNTASSGARATPPADSNGTNTHTPFFAQNGTMIPVISEFKRTETGLESTIEAGQVVTPSLIKDNAPEGKSDDPSTITLWTDAEVEAMEKFAALHLQKPNGQPWTKTSVHINTGKRPMIKYPLIWCSPHTIWEIKKLLDRKLPDTHHREVFLKCQSRVEAQVAKGKMAENCDSQSWLTGFCLNEVLSQLNEEVKVKRNSERQHAR